MIPRRRGLSSTKPSARGGTASLVPPSPNGPRRFLTDLPACRMRRRGGTRSRHPLRGPGETREESQPVSSQKRVLKDPPVAAHALQLTEWGRAATAALSLAATGFSSRGQGTGPPRVCCPARLMYATREREKDDCVTPACNRTQDEIGTRLWFW